jgi:NarL family two-component system response regulator LiaR
LIGAPVYSVTVKKAVLLYGVSGGLLITALKVMEYRFLVLEHSVEIYGGLIALLFAGVGIWLGLSITRKKEVIVVKEVAAPAADRPFAVDEERVRSLGITPRELEILQLMARGMSTREIADALFVSENTVKTHSSRLFDKLGVNRRIKAVQAGKTLGLIHPNG